MKLSDMSFDAMMGVVTTFAAEIDPLLDDDAIMNISIDAERGENETTFDYGRRVSKKIFGVIMLISGKYKPALCRILAQYFQCTADEVGQMSLKKIVVQVKDSLDDEVLLGFFPQLRQLVQAESSDILPEPDALPQKRRWLTSWNNSNMSKSR